MFPHSQVSARVWFLTIVGVASLGATLTLANAAGLRARVIHALAVVTCKNSSACEQYDNKGSGDGLDGFATSGNGVAGSVEKGTGVAGLATSGRGLFGQSDSGDAIQAVSTSGVAVNAASKSGKGGAFNSTDNVGLLAQTKKESTLTHLVAGLEGIDAGTTETSQTAGVSGSTPNSGAGVIGLNTNPNSQTANNAAVGVYAQSLNGTSTYGLSVNAVGGWFENTASSLFTLIGQADTTGAFPFLARNKAEGGFVSVDGAGNLAATGSCSCGSKGCLQIHHSRIGHDVAVYAAGSTESRVEDVGDATLVNGRAVVQLARDFAALIDSQVQYHVFLTPMGDSRGLYVSQMSPTAFEVRESQHGRSTLEFDYRVIAHPADTATLARLPEPNLGRVRAMVAKVDALASRPAISALGAP